MDTTRATGTGHDQEIPVKVYCSDDRVTVAAPMPGLEPDDITVDVARDGRLVLRGAGRGAFKGENDVVRDEWNPGPYHRELELPHPVDGAMANVTYNNGVLVVALPIRGQETLPARLTLDALSPTHGERVGNQGHPVRAPGR